MRREGGTNPTSNSGDAQVVSAFYDQLVLVVLVLVPFPFPLFLFSSRPVVFLMFLCWSSTLQGIEIGTHAARAIYHGPRVQLYALCEISPTSLTINPIASSSPTSLLCGSGGQCLLFRLYLLDLLGILCLPSALVYGHSFFNLLKVQQAR
jgi:hypothetical protein